MEISAAAQQPSAGLEWLQQDKRRALHVVYRVGDLQARALVVMQLHHQADCW
jgi:hypothetical protein